MLLDAQARGGGALRSGEGLRGLRLGAHGLDLLRGAVR
jgi:hypothetical protein